MKNRSTFVLSIISAGFICSNVLAQTVPAMVDRKIPEEKNIILFPNEKGEVVFNHTKHSKVIKPDSCILCHRTDHPTQNNVMTRFDNHRVAHYFCKGCHREEGKGPTECHECHNYKKKKN